MQKSGIRPRAHRTLCPDEDVDTGSAERLVLQEPKVTDNVYSDPRRFFKDQSTVINSTSIYDSNYTFDVRISVLEDVKVQDERDPELFSRYRKRLAQFEKRYPKVSRPASVIVMFPFQKINQFIEEEINRINQLKQNLFSFLERVLFKSKCYAKISIFEILY